MEINHAFGDESDFRNVGFHKESSEFQPSMGMVIYALRASSWQTKIS